MHPPGGGPPQASYSLVSRRLTPGAARAG